MNDEAIFKKNHLLTAIFHILLTKEGLYLKKELIILTLQQISLFISVALIVTFLFPILIPPTIIIFCILLFIQFIYYKSTVKKIEEIKNNLIFRYKYNCYLTENEVKYIESVTSIILSEKIGLRDLINNK